MELYELFAKKNHVLSDGLNRRYIINAFNRRFDMEHTTPISLHLLVNKTQNNLEETSSTTPIEYVIKSRSWVHLLKELVIYLQKIAPKSKEELFLYRTDWSKAFIFSDHESIENITKIDEGLYFSVNYTATHSLWILGDLLRFYNIDVGYVVIHRPPNVEPKEIKEELEKIRKEEFKYYLMDKYQKSEEYAEKVIKGIGSLNKILTRMSASYNNFFLFDDTQTLSNFKARLLQESFKYVSYNEAQLRLARIYLDYLSNFYTKIKKEAKINSENLEFIITKEMLDNMSF